jgi:hypothetical protein
MKVGKNEEKRRIKAERLLRIEMGKKEKNAIF